ncbi:hypothetical protein R1sor_004258 [Riccia sorocarpa]|uniref:Uncharacterized protein n=1 Tax=Riccia sorocarpa TaxID=122646 RepID=A0ABD3H637_9MARC
MDPEFEDQQERSNELLKAFALFMELQQAGAKEMRSTKALQTMVDKYDRFNGRNITKYLRAYKCKMELNRVLDKEMIESFELVVIPEIRSQVKVLCRVHGWVTWNQFERLLKDEFFDDDEECVTKRSFLEWVEQQLGRNLTPNDLLREFEARFSQLSPMEKLTIDMRKTELFLLTADEALEDKLSLLLADSNAEGGIATEWKNLEEAIALLTKQRLIDELMKTMKELKVDIAELKRKLSPTRAPPRRDLPRLCIWCDSVDHERRDCRELTEALRNKLVFFKEGKIHLTKTGAQINTNFGKGGMRKVVETTLGSDMGPAAYTIGLERKDKPSVNVEAKVELKTEPPQEVMVRGAEVIRKVTGWTNPVDTPSIQGFVP